MQRAITGPAVTPSRTLWPILLVALGGGCAGQPPSRARVRDVAPVGEAAGPSFASPAHWDFHAPLPDTALTWMRIGEAGCLLTAETGQRWLTSPLPNTGGKPPAPGTCAGNAEVASSLAPEDLTSIIRRSDKSWLFVGESGTLYEAPEPLAAFTRTVTPPEPFSRVAGAGSTVLASTYGGKVYRFQDATGWQPLPSTPQAARIFDVAVAEGGHALLLAFPEALFTSSDSGATWAPAQAKTVGVTTLGVASNSNLVAQGLLTSLEWSPKQKSFTRTSQALLSASPALKLGTVYVPTISAVTEGRAALDGDRYVEALRPDTEGDDWLLARGKIEGRLATSPLLKSDDCNNLRLGLRGKFLFTICVSLKGSDLTATIRRSQDGGDTFGEPLYLSTADPDQMNIAVSPEGNALITGACKSSSEGSTNCRPIAPLLVRPDGAKLKAMGTGASQLMGLAVLPAYSFDGHSAYFLGRRGKDEKITLFVSHDGGETFSQRSLESTAEKPTRRPHEDEDEEEGSEGDVSDYLQLDESSSLHPGEDGTVGILLQRYRGPSYITADEDGRVLGSAAPPTEEAIIGGYGRRVVAFSVINDAHYGDRPSVKFWESVDGGVAWDEQAAPITLTPVFARGAPAVTCALGGCLFGDTVTRVGWGGQPEPGITDHAAAAAPTSTPSVLTPIVCDLSPTAKWSRIEHIHIDADRVARPPDINAILRGRSVWSVLTSDTVNGAVGAVSATLPESGEGEPQIVTRTLLGARSGAGHAATAISRQVEGYAAVRVNFAVEKDGELKPNTPMRNVSVAWENYMEGTSGQGRIADAGVIERTDIGSGAGDYILNAGLITVTVRGIVVRPHSQKSRSLLTFFLDPAGKSERVTLPDYPAQGPSGALNVRTDAVAIDGQLFGVGLVRDAYSDVSALLLARRTPPPAGSAETRKPGAEPSDHWEFNALSIAPIRSSDSPFFAQADWTYAAKASIGVTSLIANRSRTGSFAFLQAFRADGTFAPPVPLATLLDLGDRPRPCSAKDRAASPRFESVLFTAKGELLFPGMRHPVLVSEPPAKNAVGISEPIALLTGAAAAHGPPASPCVAGWEAKGVGRSTVSAMLSGDLARSWLFRIIPAEPGRPAAPRKAPDPAGAATLEYRPMACRFDPTARIPETIWGEPGTARLER